MDKMVGKLACVGLGVMLTLAYQKYNKQMMSTMDNLVSKAANIAQDKLDEMM